MGATHYVNFRLDLNVIRDSELCILRLLRYISYHLRLPALNSSLHTFINHNGREKRLLRLHVSNIQPQGLLIFQGCFCSELLAITHIQVRGRDFEV